MKRTTTRKPAEPKPETCRILLLTLKGGNQKQITIPHNARVTFGMVAASNKYSEVLCLRVYKGNTEKDQIGVFTNVLERRDQVIQVKRKEVKVARKNVMFEEGGIQKMRHVEAKTSEWVDEDNPENTDAAEAAHLQIAGEISDDF